MLKLRGHHLICLHFFSGEGYDAIFIENLKNILKRAAIKEIEVCSGADDVCIKCPYLKDYKCQYDEDADEEINEMDALALSLLEIEPQTKIKWQEIKGKIPEIFPEWSKNYCDGCDWEVVCEKSDFYHKVKGGG